MALVCDIESNLPSEPTAQPVPTQDDLEDGEIEDDDEEESPSVIVATPADVPTVPDLTVPPPSAPKPPIVDLKSEKPEVRNRERERERRRHEDKGRKHMTEAEKSILHLRKREKMQRERWEKSRKEHGVVGVVGGAVGVLGDPADDDFAKNIEATLATILNKKSKQASSADEDVKEEEKQRGRKRKKHDKERGKSKKLRTDSPKSEELDENEMLNIRGGGSPPEKHEDKRDRSLTPHTDDSFDSEYSSDRSKGEGRKRDSKRGSRRNREHRNKNRDRDKRGEIQLKDSQGVCVFYLQGKCQKNDCPYSHEAVPPMKLELCKFYLMDCCAKGEKCSYMHSEFPCKFYHTGLQCAQGDNCKFAHGKPLSEGLKQILFKHIETAPRDILGGFPRMSREEVLNKINVSQKSLQEQYGVTDNKDDASKFNIPSLFDISVPMPVELIDGATGGTKPPEKPDKPPRNRRSRWQDPDPDPTIPRDVPLPFPLKPFNYGQDQDMRINSNGDIDMRTLPSNIANLIQHDTTKSSVGGDIETSSGSPPKQDVDIRKLDVDIRQQNLLIGGGGKDVDIRQLPSIYDDEEKQRDDLDLEDENRLEIDTGESDGGGGKLMEEEEEENLPDLPKTQRDLFMRIQAQQKDNQPEVKEAFQMDESSINWYSDDDDDDDENRLTIKVEGDEAGKSELDQEKIEAETEDEPNLLSPPQIRPLEMVEKLGDLSKIDISAEVTKLLTSMSQKNQFAQEAKPIPRDPRTVQNDPRTLADPRLGDPRKSRHSSTDSQKANEKLSIYEQGSIDLEVGDVAGARGVVDVDLRAGGRSDVDLRNLQLPFKGMQNYTPATEIDASINSHGLITWKVYIVEVPRPDYTGLKLSVNDAEKTGDPRLRKIFRLSTEEKDSPASPKASPKASGGVRVDPRLRKMEEAAKPQDIITGAMSYNQQLNMLQSSAFYQSLTSNQKLLLNQELASRTDQSGSHDPILNSMLSNLNLIPGAVTLPTNQNLGVAMNILANVSKLNPLAVNPAILNQNASMMVQPGLLGAAPGIPNIPDFAINFDPRNGGLLGNAPPPPFGNFQQEAPPGSFGNFSDDFYQPDGGNFQMNNPRDNRGFNRDRRRGRNNFNRNNGNRNFRNNRNNNNRSNRSHTPP